MEHSVRHDYLNRLAAVEAAARGNHWQRLAYAPWRYLAGMVCAKVLYPLSGQPCHRQAPTFFGRPMQVALPAGLDIFLLGAKTHDSEIRLARYLVKNLATGSEVLDIGAHFGFYSLLCAQLIGPQGRVLAVEASPATFAVLERNLKAADNIQGLRAAASKAASELIFMEYPLLYSEFNTLQSSSSDDEPYSRGMKPKAIPTLAYRMDQVLETYRLSPAFIKIDVEGAEDLVIEGLSEWLERRPPAAVAMEYLAGRETDTYRKATTMLASFGWQAFSITASGNLCPCPDIEAYLGLSELDSDNIIFQPLN